MGAECYHFVPTFLELRGDGFGDFFGGVGVDVVEAFLNCVEQRTLILVMAKGRMRILSK